MTYLLRRAWAWLTDARNTLGFCLGLLVAGGLHLGTHYYQGQQAGSAQARDAAADQARARRQQTADSAANFTAGRLFEQRIAQKDLRHEDETHDSTRRPAGFIRLPAFPLRRP